MPSLSPPRIRQDRLAERSHVAKLCPFGRAVATVHASIPILDGRECVPGSAAQIPDGSERVPRELTSGGTRAAEGSGGRRRLGGSSEETATPAFADWQPIGEISTERRRRRSATIFPVNVLRNIVVGLDFTPASREALRQAARIAAWDDATLHALHVIESSAIDEMLAFVGLGRDESWDAIRARGRELAKHVAADGRLAVGARTDVEVGSPVELLSRAVRTHDADLLVLGVRSPASTSRGLGPVATGCLRHASTKVLLAREDHAGPYKSIVACTDFSDTSFWAVQMAVRVAQQDKATLRVMHIAMPPRLDMAFAGDPLGFWPGQPLEVMEMWNDYRASLEPRLEKFIEPLRPEMSALNVTLDIAEHEHYGRGIAAYAKQHKADLMVLGNQGKTNLRHTLLGSTAERALAEFPCSTLVVKPIETVKTPTDTLSPGAVASKSVM